MNENRRDILMRLYEAYNDRDLESAMENLAPEVDWPDMTTGARIVGRSAMRAYWEGQWQAIDARVEPLSMEADADGRVHVRVHRLLRSPDGGIIENRQVGHIFTFDGPFIQRMDIIEIAQDDEDEDDEEQ